MFDDLLDGLETEIRLSEYYNVELESVSFYKGMLRAMYHRALAQKEGDAGNEG